MAFSFNRVLSHFAPDLALSREANKAKFDILHRRRSMANASYPVVSGPRSKEFRRNNLDANSAARGAREPLAFIGREMLRNNPRVVRAVTLIANHTVQGGVRPVVVMKDKENEKGRDRVQGLIDDHLLTTAVDADGRVDLFGLQRLSMMTIPTSGEVLLRRRLRRKGDGLPLPFQIQMLEGDFLSSARDGLRNGVEIADGIEFSPEGKRLAYHLYSRHPGGAYGGGNVRRVAAEHIAHSYFMSRPGQMRGVSWLVPVMAELQMVHKFMQATLDRQSVAAMFAGVIKRAGDEGNEGGKFDDQMNELVSGSIFEIDSGDELEFTNPPDAESAPVVINLVDRVIAAALGLSFESFTASYRGVNYTGGRMGRMDNDPTIKSFQQQLIVNQQMSRVSEWFKEAVSVQAFIEPTDYQIKWTAPERPVVDPTKDFAAMKVEREIGLNSRRGQLRQMGRDAEGVEREIQEEDARERASDQRFKNSTVDDTSDN
jgi:lambda family phage portal protein